MAEFTIEHRIVLVTGASSGVGEAVARALAAEGATVVAAARRVDRITALCDRLTRDGGQAMPLALDVLDAASIAAAIDRIGATYGRLDGLVNAAGVLGKGSAADRDIRTWRPSIATNLLGPMLVTQAAMPLLALPGSHIVNISSTATRNINAGNAPYVAAKGGLNAFTESLRRELVPAGIRVTLLLPGLIESEFFARGGPSVRSPYQSGIRPLQPADVANAVVFAMLQPPHVTINEIVIRPTDLPHGSAAAMPR